MNFPTQYFLCGMALTVRHLVLLLTSVVAAAGQVAPTFTTQPISQTGAIGGNVTFTVAATGAAPLVYQWYKDGVEIAGATGTSLTINGVKTSDFGSYQASVNNATTRIRAVSAGYAHTLYVKTDGTLWAMGNNDYGQLGDGTTTQRNTPVQVATGVASVSAGYAHTLYVKTDGTLWAMGYNFRGRLGDGTTTQRNTPVQVATGVASVAAGNSHTLYVKTDGSLWAVGENVYGQLGDGTTTNRSSPVQVATSVASLAASGDHTMYVKTDSTLWAAGNNQTGKLGDGTQTQRNTPVPVAVGVACVSAGGEHPYGHTLFVKTDGTLWAMGNNFFGQLGVGTTNTNDRRTPVPVATGVASVSAGLADTMYVKTDGTLWAMGYNHFGQLGDGTTTQRNTPVQVATGVASVSAGGAYASYVKTDGTLWAMGNNQKGQLGDGTTTQRNTPVLIAGGLLSNVALLSLPLAITTQPSAASAAAGKSVSLFVVASGTAPTYQWKKDGVAISGATAATYTITFPLPADTGSYTVTVTNSLGSVTSSAALLTVTFQTTPSITTQPSAATVTAGSTASLSVVASGTAPLSYQWRKDGGAISGATSSTYSIGSTSTSDAGSYTVVVTNSAGSVTSNAATLTVKALPRLYSLAVRTVLEADQVLIVGFTMSGGGKNVLLRAVGPTLDTFGVPGTMTDPKLDLYSGSSLVTSNDNWGGGSSLAATFQSAGAFAYASATSLDAALVASINGGRTAHVYGRTAGAVLVEGYDVGTGDAQRFTSLSARNRVGTGANILIAGFSLSGEGMRNLLIRAVGPTLGVFGVPGVLSDPKLEIYQGSTKIGENDNWSAMLSTAFSSVGAFQLTPGSKDAAITVSLPAGGYTVQVSGADGGVGEALVEIYELP